MHAIGWGRDVSARGQGWVEDQWKKRLSFFKGEGQVCQGVDGEVFCDGGAGH